MTSNLSHCFQSFRIQLERLSYLRVISQNNSQFLIQSIFDIGRNVDLVDTKLSSLTDLFIRLPEPPCSTSGTLTTFLISLRSSSFSSGLQSLRIQTVSGSDCNCKTVAVGLLYELNSLFRFGVNDVGSTTLQLLYRCRCFRWYQALPLQILPADEPAQQLSW